MATHSVKLSILDQRLIVYIDHNVHSVLGEKKGGKERDTEAMASGGSLMVRGRGVRKDACSSICICKWRLRGERQAVAGYAIEYNYLSSV